MLTSKRVRKIFDGETLIVDGGYDPYGDGYLRVWEVDRRNGGLKEIARYSDHNGPRVGQVAEALQTTDDVIAFAIEHMV